MSQLNCESSPSRRRNLILPTTTTTSNNISTSTSNNISTSTSINNSRQQPLHQLAFSFVLLFILATTNQTTANLCTLCQSLRDHLPTEFHSCWFRNLEIRHCDDSVDTPYISALKIVGVKRTVRVNYEQGDGVIWWEVRVSVIQDGGGNGDSSHHHNQNTSLYHGSSSQQLLSINPHSTTQEAIIRFNRYPASILLQNPCRHVLGTINYNNVHSGKAILARKNLNQQQQQQQHHVPTTTTQQQRIGSMLPAYFVIDDKMCRDGGGHRGMMARKRKCIPNPSNSSHPYDCCIIQSSSSECPVIPPPPQQTKEQSNTNTTDEQDYLRPLILSIQCICICFTFILSCVIFWIRKSKVIQVSVWPLTESIIFGSTLLYAAVALRASYKFDLVELPHHRFDNWFGEGEDEVDQSKYWACIAEPWTRELGFTLVYGGIVLKIYRNLVEFKTRKAHRWVVREKDILRYLGTTVSVTFFYLVSWSCTVGEFRTAEGNNGIICPAITNWHRITEIGELLYVAVGLNMAWHLRTSPVSPFQERQMYTAALVLEATASVLLIIVRECKVMFFSEGDAASQGSEIDYDGETGMGGEEDDDGAFLLLLYFVRCQITTTIILGLVLGPKLYYVYVDATTRKRAGQLRRGDTLTATGGAGGAPTSASLSNLTTLKIPTHGGIVGVDHATLIDLDFAEVSLAEMDPQDIKTELKRVYTQLEQLRNKTMRKDNPHISKRRGGRKPTHRRFSLQKKGSRDKTAAAAAAMRSRMQAQTMQEESRGGYGSNRFSGKYHDDIEDSVCSIEGPSTYSEVGSGYR